MHLHFFSHQWSPPTPAYLYALESNESPSIHGASKKSKSNHSQKFQQACHIIVQYAGN